MATAVLLVSILQSGDWARYSTPARHYLPTCITTTDIYQVYWNKLSWALSKELTFKCETLPYYHKTLGTIALESKDQQPNILSSVFAWMTTLIRANSCIRLPCGRFNFKYKVTAILFLYRLWGMCMSLLSPANMFGCHGLFFRAIVSTIWW